MLRWATVPEQSGPKSRLAADPLSVGGGAGYPSNTMSRGPWPSSVPSGILIHPTYLTTIHQRHRQTDRHTDRQDIGPPKTATAVLLDHLQENKV